MQFKLDENLPVEAQSLLVAGGHAAETVFDESLNGAMDIEVADACRQEHRKLLTLDLDFADIRRYPPSEHAGVVVLRPHSQSRRSVLNLLRRLIPKFSADTLMQSLWIVDEAGIRMRSARPPIGRLFNRIAEFASTVTLAHR